MGIVRGARPAPPPVKVTVGRKLEHCSACRSEEAERAAEVAGGMVMVLCTNPVLCGRRFRRGHTHMQYAEALRTGDAP